MGDDLREWRRAAMSLLVVAAAVVLSRAGGGEGSGSEGAGTCDEAALQTRGLSAPTALLLPAAIYCLRMYS
jgi:hypothetical protein